MSHLDPIYAVWGHNAEALAADIDEPGVKVRQWRNRGNIPSDYWPRIIAEAAKKDVTLTYDQFIRPAAAVPIVCDLCDRSGECIRACVAIDCPSRVRRAA